MPLAVLGDGGGCPEPPVFLITLVVKVHPRVLILELFAVGSTPALTLDISTWFSREGIRFPPLPQYPSCSFSGLLSPFLAGSEVAETAL